MSPALERRRFVQGAAAAGSLLLAPSPSAGRAPPAPSRC